MVFNLAWGNAGEQTITVSSNGFYISVGLLKPVWEFGLLCQMLYLIDKATTPTATIGFLQCGDIKVLQYIGDTIKGGGSLLVWAKMLPTTSEVVMIAAGLNTDLNIEGDEIELIRGPVCCRQGREKIG
jgi:hypothetical protein